MAVNSINYQDAKSAFIFLYGDTIFNEQFGSFDEAFRDAWDSFDFIPGAETPEQFAEGMTECWQMQEAL